MTRKTRVSLALLLIACGCAASELPAVAPPQPSPPPSASAPVPESPVAIECKTLIDAINGNKPAIEAATETLGNSKDPKAGEVFAAAIGACIATVEKKPLREPAIVAFAARYSSMMRTFADAGRRMGNATTEAEANAGAEDLRKSVEVEAVLIDELNAYCKGR